MLLENTQEYIHIPSKHKLLTIILILLPISMTFLIKFKWYENQRKNEYINSYNNI